MPVHDGYERCQCPIHGVVCAKRRHSTQRGPDDPMRFYECPGTPADRGRCIELLKPLGHPCKPSPWVRYFSDQR